ncbi:GspH/FimT family pseudopilin [Stutzerimonas stutzeri]|uniref:Type II secretion system protein H n=1 Tax=Stutzerimonas stutzeri TaxID=316 RepID=A0AA42H9P7_STUST|nr:GspH/FimT family pseudopilin [Stutzerimonas stutzeri]NMY62856.1 fimbrial biogenesis protein FimT [Pseudomonas sp. WS 5018]MCQ4224447.1 GspH/FimT family pseudopilin [Stutzerimonas stutzeri]MDH0148253.1 GspH/FimT family pseudopilin [Stutzerimonas stutzeri]MDH0152625.1 GspH/FimT family pseudopilin [Stutzerimonas stutzeri]MDH0155144.1 GspH/FimT family pseudopilin [Stutzerimonas stutzeri]
MKETNTGMSLAELLIIVSIVSVASSIALPAFFEFLQHNRLEALVDQLQRQVALARETSVANHHDIELCGTADGAVCEKTWDRGWMIRSPLTGAVLSYYPIEGQQQLRWAGTSNAIRFQTNGTTKFGNGRFFICDHQGEVAWQLVLNRQGRVKRIRGLEKNQQVVKPCA